MRFNKLIALFQLIICLLCFSFTGVAQNKAAISSRGLFPSDEQEKEVRIALVIGNGDYPSGPLRNPANDAKDVASALREIGFEVLEFTNLNKKDMEEAINKFGQKLKQQKKNSLGLFYYSGHAVQLTGRGYLLPTDYYQATEQNYQLVDIQEVLIEMGKAQNQSNIVILDSCRNNPFIKGFKSISSGLATVSAPVGTMICYSTAPDSVASDGEGRNGLYTAALLKFLDVPGLPIDEVMRNIRQEVKEESSGKQIPWEVSSLERRLVLRKTAKERAPSEVTEKRVEKLPAIVKPDANKLIELEFWSTIKNSNNGSDYQEYLKKYPNGEFAVLAKNKITVLSSGVNTPALSSDKPSVSQTINEQSVQPSFDESLLGDFVEIPANIVAGKDSNKEVNNISQNTSKLEIAKFEVTQALWQAIMNSNPSKFQGKNLPVESVSWEDIQQFLKQLNDKNKTKKYIYRLPTEAEWDAVYRASANDTQKIESVAWYDSNANGTTHSVGEKNPDKFGLFDMKGNVWEWCQDWYEGDTKNSENKESLLQFGHVIRGGSFLSNPSELNQSARDYDVSNARRPYLGFRLVRSNNLAVTK